jgi:hypothetical protein
MIRTATPPNATDRVRSIDLALLLTLLIPVFVLNCWLALTFHRLGITGQFNVIFDTDLSNRMACYAGGWSGFGRNLAHPNLCNFTNPLVRVVATVTGKAGFHANTLDFREHIALFIAPVAGVIQLVTCFLTLRCLAVPRPASFALVLLDAVSFSYVIFASVPDHFVLGGLGVMLALYAGAKVVTTGTGQLWRWMTAGLLAAGITITNMLGLAAVLFASYRQVFGWKCGLRKAVLVCGLIGTVTLVIYVVMALAYHAPLNGGQSVQAWTGKYFRDTPGANLASFPLEIGSVIAPAAIGTKPNTFITENANYHIQLYMLSPITHMSWATAIQLACVLAVLGGLVIAARRPDLPGRPLAIACGAFLLFNGLLHAFWGGDYFLFSQHWQSCTILLIGLLIQSVYRRWGRLAVGLVLATALATAIHSILLLEQMLTILKA